VKFKEWFAFILLGLIWGSSFLWIKIAVQDISPFLLVAFRLLFGILGLIVVVVATHPVWPRDRKTWLNLTLLGLTNNALPYVLISWGEQYIDSAVAAILDSTVPLFTMLLAHFLLTDDRIIPYRLFSMLIGFLGVVILVIRDINNNIQTSFLGQTAVILACISYAISTIIARRTTQDIAPAVRAVIPLFGADILLWTITPIIETHLTLPHVSLTWIAVIWLGVMGVTVAYVLYFYLLHSVGPTRTTFVTYLFPLVGVILGVIFLREKLDWNLAVGAVLIVGSIIFVNKKV
jgi:drug/metabolite transporter (DMT)-like permease